VNGLRLTTSVGRAQELCPEAVGELEQIQFLLGHPMILDAAIVSPYFLLFNPVLNAFEETPFHTALSNLRAEKRQFNQCYTSKTMVVVNEHSPKQHLNRDDTVAIEPNKSSRDYFICTTAGSTSSSCASPSIGIWTGSRS
jgi:hypothetical protein